MRKLRQPYICICLPRLWLTSTVTNTFISMASSANKLTWDRRAHGRQDHSMCEVFTCGSRQLRGVERRDRRQVSLAYWESHMWHLFVFKWILCRYRLRESKSESQSVTCSCSVGMSVIEQLSVHDGGGAQSVRTTQSVRWSLLFSWLQWLGELSLAKWCL